MPTYGAVTDGDISSPLLRTMTTTDNNVQDSASLPFFLGTQDDPQPHNPRRLPKETKIKNTILDHSSKGMMRMKNHGKMKSGMMMKMHKKSAVTKDCVPLDAEKHKHNNSSKKKKKSKGGKARQRRALHPRKMSGNAELPEVDGGPADGSLGGNEPKERILPWLTKRYYTVKQKDQKRTMSMTTKSSSNVSNG